METRIRSASNCAEACGRSAVVRGRCRACYQRKMRTLAESGVTELDGRSIPICKLDDCSKWARSKGYCQGHYLRWKRYGDPFAGQRRDGRTLDRNGYVLVRRPGHPMASKRGWVPEHRLVMSRHLGRDLLPEETVHHRNGVKTDNRIANLELWVSRQPKGQRPADLVAYARWILEHYAQEVEDGKLA